MCVNLSFSQTLKLFDIFAAINNRLKRSFNRLKFWYLFLLDCLIAFLKCLSELFVKDSFWTKYLRKSFSSYTKCHHWNTSRHRHLTSSTSNRDAEPPTTTSWGDPCYSAWDAVKSNNSEIESSTNVRAGRRVSSNLS